MEKSDILIKIDNLSIYMACLEHQIKDMNKEMLRILDEMVLIKKFLRKENEKNNR